MLPVVQVSLSSGTSGHFAQYGLPFRWVPPILPPTTQNLTFSGTVAGPGRCSGCAGLGHAGAGTGLGGGSSPGDPEASTSTDWFTCEMLPLRSDARQAMVEVPTGR